MPKRLLRGVIDFGDNRITTENLEVNYMRLFTSRYEFHNPDERKIWTFVLGYHQSYGEVPSAALVTDYFDRTNELTVTEKLLDVKAVEVYVRTHYATLLEQAVDAQKTNKLLAINARYAEILSKGIIEGEGRRKRKLQGRADADRDRADKLAELDAQYAEPEEAAPAPITTELNPPGPFPLTVFPSRVQKYLEAAADTLGVPQDMMCFAALGVLGLASQRKLRVRMSPHRIEPCVLWMMLIAPSGGKKSPVYKELMRPVHAWTKREYESRETRLEELKNDIKLEQRVCSVKGADKSHLQELQDELEKLPPRKRATIQDITASKLIGEFAAQQGVKSLCVTDDDRNRFADFAGGRFQAVNEMSILHNAYDGSQIEFDRRGSNGVDPSTYLPEARFGAFLLTHPSTWDDIIDPRNTYKDGLIGRLTVYVHPGVPEVTRASLRRPRIPLDPELQDEWDRLITTLLTDPEPTEPELGEVTLGEGQVSEVEISVENQRWWTWVDDRAQLAVNKSDVLNPYLTWTSKWAAKMARMYGILAYARQLHGEGPPTEEAMDGLMQCVLRHAIHALGPTAAAQSPHTELQEADALARSLVESAQKTGRWITTVRDITREHRRIPAAKIRKILETLDAAGHVQLVELDRRKVEVRITRPKLALVAAE